MSRAKEVVDPQVPLTRGQQALRTEARRFFSERLPASHARDALAQEGIDEQLWAQLAAMEWTGILVPEEHGGAQASVLECALLMEEMGRSLFSAPYLSTAVLGASSVLHSTAAEAPGLLSRIADGTLRVSVARPATPERCDAEFVDGRWQLSGRLGGVLDGASADAHVIVASQPEGERGTFLVAAEADGVTVSAESTMDLTRRFAVLEFDTAAAIALALEDAPDQLGWAQLVGAVAIAAEMVGGATRCLELSTAWAKERHQFGRPIGSFQAIKHKCVDLLVEIECARAAVRLAARLTDGEAGEGLGAVARFALARAGAAYRNCAAATIQIHGGMGYTWDHDAHLHLRRAKGTAAMVRTTVGL